MVLDFICKAPKRSSAQSKGIYLARILIFLAGRCRASGSHIEIERKQPEFSLESLAFSRIDSCLEELAKTVNLFPKLHFDGKAARVPKHLESEFEVLRNKGVVVQLQGLSLSGEIVERTLFLRLPNA
jgi:hypothetical protein